MSVSSIRSYDPNRDQEGLRRCIIELQEHERSLEPWLPPGEVMADAYLDFLMTRCQQALHESGLRRVSDPADQGSDVDVIDALWASRTTPQVNRITISE
jgi:hypothetical protein